MSHAIGLDDRTARLLPVGREWLGLGAVVAIHALALAGLMLVPNPAVITLAPPTIAGVLVQAPEPVKAPAALPVQSRPEPKPQPKPRLTPRPVRPPLPLAPPSERAVTPPPPEPPATAVASEAAPAAMATPVAAAPAPLAPESQPVQLPRSDASHLNNPLPAYPALSKRLREMGTVRLRLLVLANGTVGEISVQRSSGYPRLDQAALSAVRQWRFVPARRGDTPIDYWYELPFKWDLR